MLEPLTLLPQPARYARGGIRGRRAILDRQPDWLLRHYGDNRTGQFARQSSGNAAYEQMRQAFSSSRPNENQIRQHFPYHLGNFVAGLASVDRFLEANLMEIEIAPSPMGEGRL